MAVVLQVAITDDTTYAGVFDDPVTEGSTVFLVVTGFSNGGAAIGSSDPLLGGESVAGAVDLFAGGVQNPGDGAETVWTTTWMLPDAAGGETSFQATITNSDSTTFGGYTGIAAYEVAELGPAPALDRSVSGTGDSGSFASGLTSALRYAPEFVLGCALGYGQTSAGAGAPWTETADGVAAWSGYQLPASSGGTYQYDMTGSGSSNWVATVVAVRAGEEAALSGSGSLGAGSPSSSLLMTAALI